MVVDSLNLKTPVPCIQGFFGDRIVAYTTQVSPKQIVNLLGHDPRSKNWKRLPDPVREIYEYLQRKTSKDRRESISSYIEERLGPNNVAIGAFPALSIAFQEPTEFVPFGAPIASAVGNLMVDISPSNVRILVDGLARITGSLDLEEEGHGDLLDRFLFPITIYAPLMGKPALSWKEMGQLFHDFNFRVQPVSKQHAVALDNSDLYIALSNKLAQCPVFVNNGGVAERAASLGTKSTELVVQTVLIRTVRGACEGRKFQEADLASVDNPNLTRDSFSTMLTSINDFLEGIANRMGGRFRERQSLHLSAPGWQALGVIHHDVVFKLRLDAIERAKVLDAIAAIDWSRYNPDWMSFGIGHPEIDKKTGHQVVDDKGRVRIALTGAGRTNVQKLIDYIRDKAQLTGPLERRSEQKAELSLAS